MKVIGEAKREPKEVGRRIYYEKSTGNLILDTGERWGIVVETTTDEDFENYTALKMYERDAVAMIPVPFGIDRDKFSRAGAALSVDLTTGRIIFGNQSIEPAPEPAPAPDVHSIEAKVDKLQAMMELMLQQLSSRP